MLNLILMTMGSALALDDSPRNEFSLEIGYLDGDDEQSYTYYNGTTLGLRGGYGINSWLTVIGSWHMNQTNTTFGYDDYESPDYDYEVSDEINSDMPFHTQLRSHEFTIGTKYDWSPLNRLHPYATTQLMLNRMGLRINEGEALDDPMVDIRGGGLGIGGVVSGGLEVRTRPMTSGLQLASHLELGYGIASKVQFDNLENNNGDFSEIDAGDLSLGGLYFRWGVGVRF